MGVKKVQDEQLVQYLFYGYSVHISILSFQRENCKRMHPLWLSNHNLPGGCALPMPHGLLGGREGGRPGHTLADNLSDGLHETGAGEVFTVRPAAAILAAAAQRMAKTAQLTAPP